MASSSSSLSGSPLLSQSEKDFIRSGCREDCRLDGRKRNSFRNYTILTGDSSCSAPGEPLIFSNGSARILSCTNGSASNNLHMLCSVKADVVHPAPDRPRHGVVTLHVDTLTPTTSAAQRKNQDQIQATLSQLLLSDGGVDTEQLCLVPDQYVWRLQIDFYLLATPDAKGTLLDAASQVLKAALLQTKLPSVTSQPSAASSSDKNNDSSKSTMDLVVDSDYQKGHGPATTMTPCIVTVTLLLVTTATNRLPQTVLILDATAEEEACAYAQVHVALLQQQQQHDDDGDETKPVVVCGVTQTGLGSLPMALLPDCVALAVTSLEQLPEAYQHTTNAPALLSETFALQ